MQPPSALAKIASFKDTSDLILLSYDTGMINYNQGFSSPVPILHLPKLIHASQLLFEVPVIPTPKQYNTD